MIWFHCLLYSSSRHEMALEVSSWRGRRGYRVVGGAPTVPLAPLSPRLPASSLPSSDVTSPRALSIPLPFFNRFVACVLRLCGMQMLERQSTASVGIRKRAR